MASKGFMMILRGDVPSCTVVKTWVAEFMHGQTCVVSVVIQVTQWGVPEFCYEQIYCQF